MPILVELTEEQASLLLLELGNHCDNLSSYAISKPQDVVAELFTRVDALVPIRNQVFRALETHHATEAKLSEYENTTELPDYSDPTGNTN